MRIRIGIVSETTDSYINQVKLCLYSLRRNAGSIKDVPVTLITNGEALAPNEKSFFEKHFSPIEFKVSPRLGAMPHTSKLNVFYSIEPSCYDVLIYLDCDTVIRKPLDHVIDPILEKNVQFLCRRGGETDRSEFFDFDALVSQQCWGNCHNKVVFEGTEEWPMFNTGVFLATSEAVLKIRHYSIRYTYWLFNDWQRKDVLENLPLIRNLYRTKVFKTRKKTSETWSIEQGAVALACIKSGVHVQYLDDVFNSWGGSADFRILHCFKSAYQFDRREMFSEKSEEWMKEYLVSEVPGKVFLSKIVQEYITQHKISKD